MSRSVRTSSPADAEARDQARAAKLEALHAMLAEQVAGLRQGKDWQAWLRVAARFPSYSFLNTLAIAAQDPRATAVCGFQAWRALGRQVDKGQHGIAILAPILQRHGVSELPATEATAAAAAGGQRTHPSTPLSQQLGQVESRPAVSPPGSEASGTAGQFLQRIGGYRIVYVFDISSTSGAPLPEQPKPVLVTGGAPVGLWAALAAQVAACGFLLERSPGPIAGANGVTNYTARTVTVRADVDDAMACKTLIHELAHIVLHDPVQPLAASSSSRSAASMPGSLPPAGAAPVEGAGLPVTSAEQCRGRIEVEAESVAFLVAQSHGLDSAGYTFPYVAGWASTVDSATPESVVRATAERVLTAARVVLAGTNHLHPPAAGVDRDLLLASTVQSTAAPATLDRAAGMHADLDSANLGASRIAGLLTTAVPTERAAAHDAPPAADVGSLGPPASRLRSPSPPAAATGPPAPEQLVAVHELAVTFYRYALYAGQNGEPEDRRARALLAERGVTGRDAAAAALGYAPHSWTALVRHLRQVGVSDTELLASGLALRSAHGTLIDRFRDRIIFPVQTESGHTVALLGRAVDPTATDRKGQQVPKYLNSPDTVLYRKGQILYGMAMAATGLSRGAVPVLVEGPMDVLAVNRAGRQITAPPAGSGVPASTFVGVAPCGTALTASQVSLLDTATGGLAARGVLVAFDGDPAGQAATLRAYELLRQAGAWPHTVDLSAGEDPASLLQQHGPAGLLAALDAARDRPLADLIVDERLDRYREQLHWAEGQLNAARSAATAIAVMPPAQAGRQVARLMTRLDLPAATLTDLVVDAATRPTKHECATPQVSARGAKGELQQQQTALQHEHRADGICTPGSAASTTPTQPVPTDQTRPASSPVQRARDAFPVGLTRALRQDPQPPGPAAGSGQVPGSAVARPVNAGRAGPHA